MKVALRRQQ